MDVSERLLCRCGCGRRVPAENIGLQKKLGLKTFPLSLLSVESVRRMEGVAKVRSHFDVVIASEGVRLRTLCELLHVDTSFLT